MGIDIDDLIRIVRNAFRWRDGFRGDWTRIGRRRGRCGHSWSGRFLGRRHRSVRRRRRCGPGWGSLLVGRRDNSVRRRWRCGHGWGGRLASGRRHATGENKHRRPKRQQPEETQSREMPSIRLAPMACQIALHWFDGGLPPSPAIVRGCSAPSLCPDTPTLPYRPILLYHLCTRSASADLRRFEIGRHWAMWYNGRVRRTGTYVNHYRRADRQII
jgi:hypothetical protein